MNRRIAFAGSFVIMFFIGFLLGFLLLMPKIHKTPQIITKTKVVTKTIVKTKNICSTKIDVQKLSSWIYKHSFRLSHNQSIKLAKILIRYNHPLLLSAIIYRESSFNLTAVSTPVKYKGRKIFAIGLMQILLTNEHIKQLKNAKIIQNSRDLFDMSTNIQAGNFILNDIINLSNGDISKALYTYCGGNKKYVNDVLQILGQLTITVKGD